MSRSKLSIPAILFLSLGFPLILLGGIELIARVIDLPSKLTKQQPLRLEMPTWMLHDANALQREPQMWSNPESLAWLSMFEPGDGYRVRMFPGIERRIKNTFSLIPEDKAKTYLVRSNSLGFRSDEITTIKDKNTYRILIFGDSSSFGWGVDQDRMFSALLKNELAAAANQVGKKIEVGNFAIPGDSSAYGQLLFDTFAHQFDPDLVILGFGANDAKIVSVPHTDQVARFRSAHTLQSAVNILRMSALFRSLQALAQPTGKPSTTPAKKMAAVSLHDYIQNLGEMYDAAASMGDAKTLLLNLCTPAPYSKAARTTAKEKKALYFNGQSFLKKQLKKIVAHQVEPELVDEMEKEYPASLKSNRLFYITSDGCHPNKIGHALVAKELADRIRPLILKTPMN